MKIDAFPYIGLRRELHSYPELSNQEKETTGRLERFMAQNGLQFQRFEGIYGGFVRIDAGKDVTLCLRADIDALPLTEDTGAEFASRNPGVMHACGHDMHASIAAGVAVELNKAKDRLNCNVVILFQPAEEANPVGGAKPVVDLGFLSEQKIDEIYGLHMWPSLPAGDIALLPGPIMGSSDRFFIEVKGRTAHAAEPHLGIDAIAIASEIDIALVHRLRREVSQFSPVSISIGSFQSFGRYNIICDRVLLEGTLRCTDEAAREHLHARIKELPDMIAKSYGGSAEAKISRGFGVVQNSAGLFSRFAEYAKEALGAEHVHTDGNPSLIAEDFYYFGQFIPALYFHMGCGAKFPLHSSCFLPDEGTIAAAVGLMAGYFLSR